MALDFEEEEKELNPPENEDDNDEDSRGFISMLWGGFKK